MSPLSVTKLARIGAGTGDRRAERYLSHPKEALRPLEIAARKGERRGRGPLEAVWGDFKSLLRLSRA